MSNPHFARSPRTSPLKTQSYGSRPPARSARSQPRNDTWKEWPSVKARIPDLPHGTTTWDIQKNLKDFGDLDFIRIEETRQGEFAHTAMVTFKPPPRTNIPWEQPYLSNGINFVLLREEYDKETGEKKKVHYKHRVYVEYYQKQWPPTTIDSLALPAVKYESEMNLMGESLDFGYLLSTKSMAVMRTVRGRDRRSTVRLALFPAKKEMTIYFPVPITSVDVNRKMKRTYRQYRFHIALDDRFFICQSTQASKNSLILHVSNPPWYSKKLQEAMQLSHDPESLKWSAEDTWTRQTDIVDHKSVLDEINQLPVSLQKEPNGINLARWTTFRLNLSPVQRDESSASLDHLLRALEDFNVKVIRDDSFGIEQGLPQVALCWSLLDGPKITQSLSEQLSAAYLPFELRYQLEVCISAGWLNEYLIGQEFLQRLSALPLQRAKQILIHVDSHQKRVYDPGDIFTDLQYLKPVKARQLPAHCIEVHSATVTATGLLIHTPSVEIANRVIRKYQRHADRFLRVRFEDDSYRGRTRLYPATNNRMINLFNRVLRTMKNGIVIGDRHYQFLAWGNSQLREHGAYFFAPTATLTIEAIRASMGTFDQEKIVAKRAARMGQCFSTTRAISSIASGKQLKQQPIADVVNRGYTFTDGVGKISQFAADLIKAELGITGPTPSAFQFRLGGCKGVLAIDKSLTGVDIKIRPSQFKFESDSTELEIIRVSEYWQSTLNRQLILVLSALGVPDEVFIKKQEICIKTLDEALVDDAAARRALRENVDPNLMTLSIASMVEHGFRRTNEPFVTALLQLYRAWTLQYLKEKAKIPITKGAFVLGVVDETNTLKGHVDAEVPAANLPRNERESMLPEIFIQYTDQKTGLRQVVKGVCFIARNPSLHRGDIRVVKAVDVPKLHHLCDVLVMPRNGDRDLPSMCSGGDLDGDDYVVCWDEELLPIDWAAEPFHYTPPQPVTRDVITNEDIIRFFCDYLQNDFLGRIAHAHLAAADYLDDGIRNQICLDLVELHSMAVDYPKTGVPAKMPRALERNQWPHFMEKKGKKEYKSRKILGKLYNAVEKVKFVPKLSDTFDPRILKHSPQKAIMENVKQLKNNYDQSMQRIMAQHGIQTEFEVWSTFVMSHSKAARDFKFHEEIGQHAKTLKDQYYEAFCNEAGSREFVKLAPYAVVAYHITQAEVTDALSRDQQQEKDEESSVGSMESLPHRDPFISFPWVLQDVLEKIAKHTLSEEELEELDEHARTAYEAAVTSAHETGDSVVFWTFVRDFNPGLAHARTLVMEKEQVSEEEEGEQRLADKDSLRTVPELVNNEPQEKVTEAATNGDFSDDDENDFTY